jgi:hypothetical protein
MVTAGTASNSVFLCHSPLTGCIARCPARNRSRPAHRRAATVAERRSPSPRCSLRSAHRARRNDGYGASSPIRRVAGDRLQSADSGRSQHRNGPEGSIRSRRSACAKITIFAQLAAG